MIRPMSPVCRRIQPGGEPGAIIALPFLRALHSSSEDGTGLAEISAMYGIGITKVTAAPLPELLDSDEAQRAGPADRIFPAVDAEPVVQACRSLLGC